MLDKGLVGELIDEALAKGGDFAEVFMEDSYSSSLILGEKQIKEAVSSQDRGVGIRVCKGGEIQAYAYTNKLDRDSLFKTARQAAQGILENREISGRGFEEVNFDNINPVKIPQQTVEKTEKAALLKEVSELVFSAHPFVQRTDGRYIEEYQYVTIANSNGLWASDNRERTRFFMSALVENEGISETAGDNIGAMRGFELYDNWDKRDFANKIADDAVRKLYAEYCPSGKMPVIINNKFGGVIFHEACGHALEATALAKKSSVFQDKLGQQIASSLVTAIDDGTLPGAWGSLTIDDEGIKTQRNVLIENGILTGYLIDSFNGKKLGFKPTGSCRRESYRYVPTSRMNNTFITNGKSSLQDIISNTEYGLFASKMSGGSVNPATGDFNFSVSEAFIVENGKIKQQVKGAKLIGKGEDILHNIDMVGNNLELACGVCGSISGSVPTTVGQPAIRVKEILVGGQK